MRGAILPIAILAAATFAGAQNQSNILIPESSIQRPEDIGRRMHTNYYMRVPDPSITPDSPPAGVTIETPGSIACIYGLATSTTGCPVARRRSWPAEAHRPS
jgi:kumamolisin